MRKHFHTRETNFRCPARTRLDRQVPADDASAPTRRAGNVVAERIPGTQLRIRCEESWQALSEESAM